VFPFDCDTSLVPSYQQKSQLFRLHCWDGEWEWGWQRGSIRQEAPGVYELRVFLGRDARGRVRRRAPPCAAPRVRPNASFIGSFSNTGKASGLGRLEESIGRSNDHQRRHRGLEPERLARCQSNRASSLSGPLGSLHPHDDRHPADRRPEHPTDGPGPDASLSLPDAIRDFSNPMVPTGPPDLRPFGPGEAVCDTVRQSITIRARSDRSQVRTRAGV
jgi:hypothetical protein